MLVGEVGPGQIGAVDVSLHLAQGDRRMGDGAVRVADAVPGVLPALVGEAPVGRPLVLDIPVAVGVAEVLDPLERPLGVGQQLVDRLAGEPPAPELAEEHDEQRRGVGGPVVDAAAAERQRRRVAEAHLVEDATGLLVASGVDVVALEAGEGLQDPERQVRDRRSAPSRR